MAFSKNAQIRCDAVRMPWKLPVLFEKIPPPGQTSPAPAAPLGPRGPRGPRGARGAPALCRGLLPAPEKPATAKR